MPYYKFNKRDLIYNRIKTFPKVEFTIARGPGDTASKVYYNNNPQIDGKYGLGTPESGYISLYEYNVDKASGSVYDPARGTTEDGGFGANNEIFPFIVKGSSMHSFTTVSSTGFHGIPYGEEITASYSMTASVQRLYYRENDSRKHVFALKSYLDRASTTSRHFAFTGSGGTNEEVDNGWDKSTQEMSIIDVPSIFYGNSVKKGSVSLKFYITGTLIGELSDIKNNGELIQIGPTGSTGSGSVAGIVMYDAGLFLLTGSWDLDTVGRNYRSAGAGDLVPSKWVYFGYGIPTRAMEESDEGTLEGQPQVINKKLQYVDMKSDGLTGSQFSMSFRGVNYIPTVTMFARAPKNRLNHSNNPTYIAHSSSWDDSKKVATITGSTIYREHDQQEINNVAYSAYNSITGSFKKTTFITEVKIYDEEMNCIGIAKLAKPVKKTPERDFTFKLKVDF
tara:strand:- start:1906 stop:3252 length:1347 start_codon:yes stop_codon:yes gene_type:complete